MAKRTRAKNLSEDSSASEFEPIPSSNKRARRRRPLAARKAPSARQTDSEALETYDTPHSLSQHLISSPDLMRLPLLEWYSLVHAARGMPWRKPFDSSLDRDARAQRAYEVRDQINVSRYFSLHLIFLCRRSGFQRSCSSRPRSLL